MRARLLILVTVLVTIATACGGSDDAADRATEASAPTATAPPQEPEPAPTAPPESTPDADVAVELTTTVTEGWSATAIGLGTKPVLALDPAGSPGMAFLFEDLAEGFVAYADAAGGWSVDPLVEGYFYGPIGLDYDLEGRPHIAYHDHQADTFRDELGDLTHAVLGADGWTVSAATSDGHDGWDSTVRVGADGVVRAAGIDPAQFGRVEGVEYYELVDGVWQVEAIGSGPVEYEWNVDLEVAPDGTPGMTYFRSETEDLLHVTRGETGTWAFDTVDREGDVGRFSSLVYDPDGAAHISYWNADTGEVRYAGNASGSWVIETVATLASVETGFEGARRITSIGLAADGSPRVAFSDVSGLWLATRTADGTWTDVRILEAGGRPLGQLVSMEIDDADRVHLAFFEVTSTGPLAGVVGYVTDSGG